MRMSACLPQAAHAVKGLQVAASREHQRSKVPQLMSPPFRDGLPDEDKLFKVPSVAAPAGSPEARRLRSLLQVLYAGSDMNNSLWGTGTSAHHAVHSWEAADQWWWQRWPPGDLQKQQTLV